MKSIYLFLILAFLFGCSSVTKENSFRGPASLSRPPQFVLLAFDGSKSVPMWKETREFAKESNVKFTYFISGVYFIQGADRKNYMAPGKSPGRSDIGFGNSKEDVQNRLRQIELAISEGHEIASHANGHFDGSKWSQEDWSFEFLQFSEFVNRAWDRNGLTEPKWWKRYFQEFMIGFRAPLLRTSAGLWPALVENRFYYDTSRTSGPTYWPRVENGVWNFPLAKIRRVGTKYSTLSMDYNFYYNHSNGKDGPSSEFENYEEEMYKSYLSYFTNNYTGNRAPIHIGHHFSKWNGGAYWKAMKRFAKAVCGMPEVRCVTYRDLLDYVARNRSQIDSYQAGSFEKASLEDVAPYIPQALVMKASMGEDALDDSQVDGFMKAIRSGKLDSHPGD